MIEKTRKLGLYAVIAIAILLLSWGYSGHYKINYESSRSFTAEMDQFMVWAATLAEHGSDADYRKDEDPTEGPKHYIDIDNYPEFVAIGRIPQTLDSVIAKYGENFVYDQGILPWATVTAYDSLVQCFLRRDWNRAVLFASDLGHYVADGHMPLHITRNYNGQYTGNSGIHSRYESAMINSFMGQVNYEGGDITFIDDVNGFVFSYLYENYRYVDSVLLADDYAQGVAGNTTSFTYKETLWNKSKSFTVPLFASASNALACLIYTAWSEAGKPMMNSSGLNDGIPDHRVVLRNYPNPFSGTTEISLLIAADSQITLEVKDMDEKTIRKLIHNKVTKGEHAIAWDATGEPPGIYLLVLTAENRVIVRKMVVL
jgi:hypothetical protein